MPRLPLTLASALLLVAACGGDPPGDSASEGSTSAASDASASHSSTSAAESDSGSSGDEGSGTSGGALPCDSDDACGATEICSLGACESLCGLMQVHEVPITHPKIALVVDTSAAMSIADVDHDADPNTPPIARWRLLREGFLEALIDHDEGAPWAAQRVTAATASQGYDAAACDVDPTPMIGLDDGLSVPELVAALPPADADAELLRGARPLRASLEAAYDHLRESDDGAPRFVLLMSAGAANCGAESQDLGALLEGLDEGVVEVVEAALDEGIPTLVVGVSIDPAPTPVAVDMEPDGVSPAAQLSQLALAGGLPTNDPTTRYHDLSLMSDGPAIADDLFGFSEPVWPGIDLLYPLPIEMSLEVKLDGVIQPALPGDTCTGDGWIVETPERNMILFCGASADLFLETNPVAEITYLCE